jgi:hypothetical protein
MIEFQGTSFIKSRAQKGVDYVLTIFIKQREKMCM